MNTPLNPSLNPSLFVEVLSPEKMLYRGDATEILAPGKLGYMTLLPGHARLISELEIGEIKIQQAGDVKARYFVAGGFLEVADNKAKILVDIVEKPSDIDLERAKKAAQRAEKRLTGGKNDGHLENKDEREDIDYTRAMAALKRAQTRISLATIARN